MKLSILFLPNTQKPVIKTGKIPMYLRVILDRRKAEMRLNIEVKFYLDIINLQGLWTRELSNQVVTDFISFSGLCNPDF